MRKNKVKTDSVFSVLAHKVHPTIGELYDNHVRFFNDGIIELICLIILNLFVFFFSITGFVGWSLVFINLFIVTPLTFCIKYFAHKMWVWKIDTDKRGSSKLK